MSGVGRSLGLLTLGFALGIAGGVGWAALRPGAELSGRIAELDREVLGERFYARYRFGEYQQAKCSLRDYVDFSRPLASKTTGEARAATLRAMGLAYARLAVLASNTGHEEDRDRLLALAGSVYRELGETPSNEDLLEVVRRTDTQWENETASCTLGD